MLKILKGLIKIAKDCSLIFDSLNLVFKAIKV